MDALLLLEETFSLLALGPPLLALLLLGLFFLLCFALLSHKGARS